MQNNKNIKRIYKNHNQMMNLLSNMKIIRIPNIKAKQLLVKS